MRFYVIGDDGKTYGPVEETTIREWLVENRLNTFSQIQVEGETTWQPLENSPLFSKPHSIQKAIPAGEIPFQVPSELYSVPWLDWIIKAWTLLMNHFGTLVLATFVVCVIELMLYSISQIVGAGLENAGGPMLQKLPWSIILVLVVLSISIFFASSLIKSFFSLTLLHYHLQVVRGKAVKIGDLFTLMAENFWPLLQVFLASFVIGGVTLIGGLMVALLIGILCGVGTTFFGRSGNAWTAANVILLIATTVLCCIPYIYLSISYRFAAILVVDQKMHWWTALETSRKTVSRRWFSLFGFFLISGLIGCLGIFLCCVGVIFTLPITYGSFTYAYQSIFFSHELGSPQNS